MRKPDKGLTPMEQEVMKVLWESQHELTNSEIAESMKDQKVSVASVAQTMKRLLEKGAVCVGDHVLVSNVYARTFHPCITRKEFFGRSLSGYVTLHTVTRLLVCRRFWISLKNRSKYNYKDTNARHLCLLK